MDNANIHMTDSADIHLTSLSLDDDNDAVPMNLDDRQTSTNQADQKQVSGSQGSGGAEENDEDEDEEVPVGWEAKEETRPKVTKAQIASSSRVSST